MGNFGVLAIYAPSTSNKHRTRLWHEVVDTLDTKHRWFFAGDFNMVLAPSDRRGGSGRIVVGAEKRAWNRLTRKLCLADSFIFKPGHLKYSLDSKKKFRHDPVVQLLP